MLCQGGFLTMVYPRNAGGAGTVPAAPTIGTASVSAENAISVTFTPNGDGGSPILHYTVLSSPGNISNTGSGSPIVVSGLTPGTSYTFTVTATNAIGTSASSAASNAVVAQGKPDAPTAPSAVAGNAQATVSFVPPVNNGGSAITSYTVTSNPGNISASGASSPITVTGLTNGTGYTFSVKANNAYGQGPASEQSNLVTPQAPAAAGPFDSLYASNWLPISDTVLRQKPVQSEPVKSTGISSPSYTDGNYGTKIFRVANLLDSPNNSGVKMRHEYSRRCPFNCDGSKFMIQNSNGFYFVYDGSTFTRLDGGVTTNDQKLAAVGTNSLHPKDPRDWIWHPTDPNKIYFFPQTDGLIMYQFDVVTKALTTKANFTGRLGAFGTVTRMTSSEGMPSDDGRYWSFQLFDGTTSKGFMTWDMQTDTITGTLPTSRGGNNCTMTPNGNYIVISGPAGTSYEQARDATVLTGVRAYSRNFSSYKQLHYRGTHADVGIDYQGNEVYFTLNQGNSNWTAIPQNSFFYITCNNSDGPVMLVNLGSASDQQHSHYSGRNSPGRPGWCVLSMYDETPISSSYLDNNIALVELKPSGRVFRIANHRTTRYTYWQEPHATSDRSGLRIMYSCSWDSTSTSNPYLAYMIGLPSWIYGGAPGGGGGGGGYILNFVFNDSTGWTIASGCSVTGGKLHCNNTTANVTNTYNTNLLTVGTYDIQYTISDFIAGNVTMRIDCGSAGIFSGTTRSAGSSPAGTYVDRVTIPAISEQFEVRVTRQGTAMDVKVDDITVTAVP